MNVKSNHFSAKGEEFTMSQKMRTEIKDLPQIAIELGDDELRIVSGGLAAASLACSSMNAVSRTGGDGDHTDFASF
jgi:hypothetical protein